jgi:hypothetical protein
MATTTIALADHILNFTQALDQAELLARQALPPVLHERLSAAYALVKGGQALQLNDGSWEVASTSTPGAKYHINGATCPCKDAHYRAHNGLCRHTLSTLLARKAMQLMRQTPAPTPDHEPLPEDGWPPEEERAPAPEAPAEPVQGIDPKFIVWISGKPFVKFTGLLVMAHDQGLVSLTAAWTHNDSDLSLAHAVAVFADGRRFEECGDSAVSNVAKRVAPHWRRMSLTRAKARCLRDALGCQLVAVEELGEGA